MARTCRKMEGLDTLRNTILHRGTDGRRKRENNQDIDLQHRSVDRTVLQSVDRTVLQSVDKTVLQSVHKRIRTTSHRTTLQNKWGVVQWEVVLVGSCPGGELF